MKKLSYSLITVGMVLALGGIVVMFHFDHSSDVFSLAWWMIAGGWGSTLTGLGIDIIYVLKIPDREPMDLFKLER